MWLPAAKKETWPSKKYDHLKNIQSSWLKFLFLSFFFFLGKNYQKTENESE